MIQVLCDKCGCILSDDHTQLEFTKLSSKNLAKVDKFPVIHICDKCLNEFMFDHGYGESTRYSQEKLPL